MDGVFFPAAVDIAVLEAIGLLVPDAARLAVGDAFFLLRSRAGKDVAGSGDETEAVRAVRCPGLRLVKWRAVAKVLGYGHGFARQSEQGECQGERTQDKARFLRQHA